MVHVAENSFNLCPNDEMRSTVEVPEYLKKMLQMVSSVNKTKAGFYKKAKNEAGKNVKMQLNPATGDYVEAGKPTFPCLDDAKKKGTSLKKYRPLFTAKTRAQSLSGNVPQTHLLTAATEFLKSQTASLKSTTP